MPFSFRQASVMPATLAVMAVSPAMMGMVVRCQLPPYMDMALLVKEKDGQAEQKVPRPEWPALIRSVTNGWHYDKKIPE